MNFKTIAMILLIVFAFGCQPTVIKLGGKAIRRPVEETQSFFIGGAVGERTLIMEDFCTDGQVARIEEKFTFGDMVLQVITFSIYSPRTVSIYCKRNK